MFIHAGVADSRMWSEQVREFSGSNRVITFDKRGYGKTPWVPGPYSDTDDAIAVLDHLDVDSAVIVGCSMGGGTAMDLAIDHPERVSGLVVVGSYPSGWVPEGGFDELPLEAEAMAAAEAGDFDRVAELEYLMFVVGYGREEGDVDPTLRGAFLEMDRRPVETEAEREHYQSGFEKRFNDHLDEIVAPTLVVVGVHDEPLLIEAAHYMAGRLGGTEPVLIENAAHLPSWEQPEAFNEVLRSFLTV